jgi:hypothetical protein
MWINIFEYFIIIFVIKYYTFKYYYFVFLTDHANKVLYIWILF